MRAIYLLLIAAGFFLASCGSSYRATQTVDDVYYSPSVQDQEYVTVYNDRERESYNYREDYEIRRGIRNPVYRNSINYSMSFGFGSPFYSPFYSSFYSPFYSPFSSFGYYSPFGHYGYSSPFYSSFYYGSFYNPFGYYPYGSLYYPSYGYGYYPSHGYGGYYPSYRIYDNGPRRSSLGSFSNTGLRTISTPGRSTTAPVRSVSPDNRRESTSPIRRIFAPNENRSVAPSRAPVRQGREYAPARSNTERRYSPAPSRQTPTRQAPPRSTSPRSNSDNYRPAPTRSFESSTPSRSFERSSSPAPSRSSGTSTGTGPRRG